VLRIFISLKNPSPWPGFEPATFASSGQHTNHYTTEATDSKQGAYPNIYFILRPYFVQNKYFPA
jgi:hypothetical protein